MRQTTTQPHEPAAQPALLTEVRASALLFGMAVLVVGGIPLLAALLSRWG